MGQGKQQDVVSQASARHGKLKRSSAFANAAKVLLTAVVVLAVSGISVAAYAAFSLAKDANLVELNSGGSATAVGAGGSAVDGALTVLLVGSDTRAGQTLDDGETGELNDVNLLLHVSADHQNATVVSFPRDLMVPIPSCSGPNGEENYYSAMSEQMLNTAIGYGGLSCVAETIENFTGIPIPHAGLITFDGVIAISNAIGGVEVCLLEPINDPYTGLNLPAGDVSLAGGDALAYLRTRHGVGNGSDVSRISNQQIFMSSLVRQLQSAETLTNPAKVFGLAKAGLQNMTLSSNMATVEFMQSVAKTVADIDLERINFVQYPSAAHPYQAGRLTPDYASAETLIDLMMSGQAFSVATAGEAVAVQEDPNAAPVDPVTGYPIDAATGWPIDPTTGFPIDPATGLPTDPATGLPVDPATVVPVDPAAPLTDENGAVVLPNNITGQSAALQTCSQGRTVY